MSFSKGKETKVETGETTEDKTPEDNMYKMLSIGFALAAGLMFSVNNVDMYYNLSLGFSPMQMNIDGNLIYALILMVLFSYEQINYQTFSASHIALAFVSVCSVTLACVSMGNAIQYGKAGPA